MTKLRRIGNVILGLFIIAFGLLVATGWDSAYTFIIHVLGFSLILGGIRLLVYYVTMARHMVDGRAILYRAVIMLDIGIFSLSLARVPAIFLVAYLAGLHGFTGIIDILRAREAITMQAPNWKLNMAGGIVNVIMAVLCLIFIKEPAVAVEIYAAGLVYSGVIRIIRAFRRTQSVYIQ